MNIEHLIEPKIKDLKEEIYRLNSHIIKMQCSITASIMENALNQAEHATLNPNTPNTRIQESHILKRDTGVYQVSIQIVRIA